MSQFKWADRRNISNVRHDPPSLKKESSPAGNRTPVSRVTGGDTHHYTTEDTFAVEWIVYWMPAPYNCDNDYCEFVSKIILLLSNESLLCSCPYWFTTCSKWFLISIVWFNNLTIEWNGVRVLGSKILALNAETTTLNVMVFHWIHLSSVAFKKEK